MHITAPRALLTVLSRVARCKPFDMKSDAKYSDPAGLGVFEREHERPSTTTTSSAAPLH